MCVYLYGHFKCEDKYIPKYTHTGKYEDKCIFICVYNLDGETMCEDKYIPKCEHKNKNFSKSVDNCTHMI